MTDTQIESLRKLKPTIETVREEVFAAIASAPDGLAAFEVADRLGLLSSSVTGRLRELHVDGRVKVYGRRYNQATDRMCQVYWAARGDAAQTGPYCVAVSDKDGSGEDRVRVFRSGMTITQARNHARKLALGYGGGRVWLLRELNI